MNSILNCWKLNRKVVAIIKIVTISWVSVVCKVYKDSINHRLRERIIHCKPQEVVSESSSISNCHTLKRAESIWVGEPLASSATLFIHRFWLPDRRSILTSATKHKYFVMAFIVARAISRGVLKVRVIGGIYNEQLHKLAVFNWSSMCLALFSKTPIL